MSEHTKEPWCVRGGWSIYASDKKTPIADTCLSDSVATKDEANARRIVACVNACEGIGTEYLECFMGTTFADFKRVKDQRDELLAAEEGAKEAFGHVVQQKRDLEEKCERLQRLLDSANETIRQLHVKGGA